MKRVLIFLGILSAALHAGAQVDLHLRTSTISVYQDEPVILVVSVSNKKAQSAERWNIAADRRLRQLDVLLKEGKVSKADYDSEKTSIENGKKKVDTIVVGSDARPWSSMLQWQTSLNNAAVEVPITILPNPGSRPVATLDERGFEMAWFGISPALKQPGKYIITVVLPNATPQRVSLEVKRGTMPVGAAARDSLQLRLARYYWHANDAVKGLSVVDELLKKDPNSIDALSLKGDLLILQRSFAESLEVFKKALSEYYRQHPGVSEPPEYLLETISWLKEQIAKAG